MEEKSKSNVGLIIILVVLVLALGGYIAYDKLLNNASVKCKNVNDTSNENELIDTTKIDDVTIDKLLSLVIINVDKNDKVLPYKISGLSNKNINDIIANFLIQGKNYVEDSDGIFQMKATEVDKVMKQVYGIDSSKFNFSEGMNLYSDLKSSIVDVKGEKYYRIEFKNGSSLANGYYYYNHYQFGELENISYKNDEITIECEVVYLIDETAYFESLGTGIIKFNIANGIKFVSFDFKAAETVETYMREHIME